MRIAIFKAILSFCFLLSINCSGFANTFSNLGEGKSPRMRTRIMIAPSISFYKINPNHATGAKQKMSGLFSIKEEFRLNDAHNLYFMIGAEYFLHGVNFYSYYFKPDSIKLYNGNMDYAYNLYIHEIDIPLQMKFSFKHENNALVTPYFMLGYHIRTLLFGGLKVKENGNEILKKQVDLDFKNSFISTRNNSFLSVALGVQKNKPNNTKRCFFAEVSFRFGISPYSFKDSFAASSLLINGNHLCIGLGMKF